MSDTDVVVQLSPFDGWACRIMASTCALSATVLLAFAGLQVPLSLSTSPSFPTRPPTPCEAMGGACIARTSPGLGQCRTDDVIAANRAFTFATEHEQLVQKFANTDNHHAYLLCEEPYSCCIEDACESVLGGVCQDSAIDAPDGHKYYSGYCAPPKHAGHVMCLAKNYYAPPTSGYCETKWGEDLEHHYTFTKTAKCVACTSDAECLDGRGCWKETWCREGKLCGDSACNKD